MVQDMMDHTPPVPFVGTIDTHAPVIYSQTLLFFFHEYGRRVGMVPRSSLKEIQSDGGEKDKDNPTTNKTKPTTAHRPRLHHQVVFPLY